MENEMTSGQQGWKLIAMIGAVSMLLGFLSIAWSFAATLATIFFLGGIVLAGGVVHSVQAFTTRTYG